MVLDSVTLPQLLPFMPEMVHTNELSQKVCQIYAQCLVSDCPCLGRVLKGIPLFLTNLKHIPEAFFDHCIRFLSSTTPQAFSDFCHNFIVCSTTLNGPQIRDIASELIQFVLNVPPSFNKTSVLSLLSALKICDMRLYRVDVSSIHEAILLSSCFPTPVDNNPCDSGDIAVSRIAKFINPSCRLSEALCTLLFQILADFVTVLSEESHSVIIETIIPTLVKFGASYQDSIADFLKSVPIDLAAMYLLEFKEITLQPSLKAANIRLHYLSHIPPTTAVTPNDAYECGIALLTIGEYSQADVAFGQCRSNILCEAYGLAAQGLTASAAFNHSLAAAKFYQAKCAFKNANLALDFQIEYCMARYYYESVCFEIEMFSEEVSEGGSDGRHYRALKDYFSYLEALNESLSELPRFSLNLHPNVDLKSRELVEEFCDVGQKLLLVVEDAVNYDAVRNVQLFCPPAFATVKCPVYVEDLRIVNNVCEVKRPNMRMFTLELRGIVKNGVDFKMETVCEIAFSYYNEKRESAKEVVKENEEFGIDFPIIAVPGDRSHVMEVLVTFKAFTEDGEYLIGKFQKYVRILELAG
jgi:tetratricopeptide (TPR) repeat protein